MEQNNELEKMLGGIIGGMGGLSEELNPSSVVGLSDDGSEYTIKGTYVADDGVQKELTENLKKATGGNLGFAAQVDLPGIENFTAPELSFPGGNNFFVPNVVGGSGEGLRFESLVETNGGIERFVSGGVVKTTKQVCTKYNDHKLDIESNLSNLIVLKKFIDEGFNKLYNLLDNCDSSVSIEVSAIKDVHNQVLSEVDNQIGHLQKVLNVTVKPTHEDLSQALDKFTTFDKVAKLLLPYEYGTSEASDRLAIAYTGVYQLKNVAKKVQKALSDANLSINDYSQTKNINELTNKLISALNKSKSVDLTNLIEAITILKNNFKNRTQVAEFIKNPKKMDNTLLPKKQGGVLDESKLGRIKSDYENSGISKSIKKSEKTITELVKLFVFDVNQKFNEIKKSVDILSSNIGSDIEYNDNLVNFINAYENMSDLTNYSLYYSLIGLNATSSSKQAKQMFIENLQLISQSIDSLTTGKYSSYFKDIKNNINNLIELIDTYTDLLSHSNSVIQTKSGGSNGLFSENTIVDDSIVTSSTSLVKETAAKLRFYGNLVALKQNLKSASTQFSEYKQGYNDLLGKTIGNKLSLINDDYTSVIKSIDSPESTDLGAQIKIYNEANTGDESIDAGLLKSMVKLQFDAKQDLYRTIEAIDLYLMNYTEHIQASPEDVSKIEKILSSVQIISKWFTEKSGDDLLSLFNSFPNIEGEQASEPPVPDFVGDVSQFIKPHKMKSILEKCKKALEGVSVLKNLIATFVYVGDNFKNKSIKESMFMSPNVIYKNLFKYLWVSSFSANLYSNSPELNNLQLTMVRTDTINDIFKVDDEYFVLALKAMVAKVYSVVGTYSLLNDPVSITNLVHNPTRMILGGAHSQPQIIDDAMELYIRLPLLLEFYRDIFNNDDAKTNNDAAGNDEESIAFIPEVGSVWSNIISLVFDKSKYIENNIYTKSNLDNMISEINTIYRHYSKESNKDNINRNITNGLVFEINKRYGILKRKDIRSYYDLIKEYENPTKNLDQVISNNLNFDILDADSEYDIPAPSNKFTKTTYSSELINYKRQMIDDKDLVKTFRDSVFDALKIDNINESTPLSFKRYIKMYTEELKASKANDQKYDIVIKAINNSNSSNINNKQYYILFHELVIAPLNILEYLHKMTNTFIDNTVNGLESTQASDNNKALGLLFRFTSNSDLVTLRHISTTSLVIDYSKLQETVESLIDNIKYVLQKFKVIINDTLVATHVDLVYKIEDAFLNKLIKNQNNEGNNSLEKLSVQLNNISTIVNKVNSADNLGKMINHKTAGAPVEAAAPGEEASPVATTTPSVQTQLEKDMYKKYTHSTRVWESVEVNKQDNRQVKGLVDVFNNLTELYVNAFYDISNKKIYSKLLDNFNNTMTSILSNDKLGYNNINTAIISLNNEDASVSTGETQVLGANITYIVKTLLQRTVNPQLDTKYHTISELQEVSPHMVERFRAQLPILIKLVKLFVKKCLFYKRVYIETTKSIEDKSKFSTMVDNIIECCTSILNDASNVLTEVNTLDNNVTPLFMELRQDFIRNYFNTVGETPFMPLSALTYYLNENNHTNAIPSPTNNVYQLKLQYGTKNILNGDNDVKLSDIIYLKELHKTYNSSVNNSHAIDENVVNSMVINNVGLLRYVNNIMYSNYLSVNDANKLSIGAAGLSSQTYYYGNSISVLINSIENTIKTSSENNVFDNMAISVTTIVDTIDRKQAKVLNIIDLNIVPINIHALLREVPLVNIYNYAHTFNDIVTRTIKTVNNGESKPIELLQTLLLEPYTQIDETNLALYDTVLSEPLHSINLNKPRFLQDQLHNRLLKDSKITRANTKIVQNLVFLCNLQRILRVHIRSKLENINSRVVDKIKITSDQITDYVGQHSEYNSNEFNMLQ